MDRVVFEYAPIIYMDKKEPFKVKKVGFAQYDTDGARSESFNRAFDFKNFKGAEKVLEYVYYLDYDIQHLYDLEHIWVYLDHEGEVVGTEGSFHGRFLNASGCKLLGKRVTMYSQPGKHAFLSDPEYMHLYTELYSSCDRLAGKNGLDAPERFLADIRLTDEENKKVSEYIKNKYSFEPSMEFEEFVIAEADYMSWDELASRIPEYIKVELGKIKVRE